MAALEPVVFYGNDGAEYHFGLTNSRVLRLVESNQAEKTVQAQSFDFLWTALLNPGGITKDDFIDNMPMDGEVLAGLADAIHQQFSSRKTDPRNDRFRPTKTGEKQLTDGSNSPDGTAST